MYRCGGVGDVDGCIDVGMCRCVDVGMYICGWIYSVVMYRWRCIDVDGCGWVYRCGWM